MRIKAAAIDERGKVWTGIRHHLIIREIWEARGPEHGPVLGEQGFVTDEDKFVTREEAAVIAFQAGQIKEPKKTLFSEDLWSIVG